MTGEDQWQRAAMEANRLCSENKRLQEALAEMAAVLERCQVVLGNMALENEGAIFNRWPISHEPLRSDARGLLPVIDASLSHYRTGEK